MLSTLLGRAAWPLHARARISRPRPLGGRRPSVSVIIPCYNYGHYIEQCVRSVLDQPGVQVDVIVIDDASPDGSAEIVSRLPAADDRVRVICHPVNQGHLATVTEGMGLVSGDYTVFLSADDLLTPGCLARATALMEENPSVGLTYGFPIVFSGSELPPARTEATSWIVWRGADWISHLCQVGRNVVRSPEAVMRTSVLRQIGGARPDLPHSGDFEFWMRAATISGVGYVAGADQAYYRSHGSNMHLSYGLLADVDQRLRAFDVTFTERAGLLPDAARMASTARRTLAREAIGHAIVACARGDSGGEPIADFEKFAVATWPDIQRSREWRTLRRRRDLPLAAFQAARNFRYSALWWRQRWTGV
jgi:CTP:molybdopterin cytidylyltransferase MocA